MHFLFISKSQVQEFIEDYVFLKLIVVVSLSGFM